MKQQKEWLNCILQTRRIEMFQWKGEEVHKHPQTNIRNGPVPLTTHCPHRSFGMEMTSYYTCSYTLACNHFKMDAENLKTKFHGAWWFKKGNCTLQWLLRLRQEWQTQDIWASYLSNEAVRGRVWGGAAIWTFETAFPLCILPLKYERERN